MVSYKALRQEILKKFQEGKTPNDLISQGYNKNTVYKVWKDYKRKKYLLAMFDILITPDIDLKLLRLISNIISLHKTYGDTFLSNLKNYVHRQKKYLKKFAQNS